MKKLILFLLLSFVALAQWSLSAADDKPVKVLFISSAHSNKAKVSLLKKVADDHSVNWHITQKPARAFKEMKQAEAAIAENDFIILDGVSSRESKSTYETYLPIIAKSNKIILAPTWASEPRAQKGLTAQQQKTVTQYWKNAGRANLNNMLSYVAAEVVKTADVKFDAPIIFPDKGLYHPDYKQLISNNLEEYFAWRKPNAEQPKIAMLFNRSSIETEQTELVDETIRQVEAKGAIAVPFFFRLARGEQNYDELLYLDGQDSPAIDLIINFRNIHWAAQRKKEFEKFGVPVIQAMGYYSGDQKAWEEDVQGVDAGMMAFTLVLPEGAGVTDPMIVAASDRSMEKIQIIDYQLEHLVNKAINLTNLKYKANQDKKITVFVWGDQDVGASFLNVPESISAIGNQLNSEGYNIPSQNSDFITDRVKRILDPFYRDYQLEELLKEDLAELMPISEYLAWFETLPDYLQTKVNDHWGKPQDNFMAVNRDGVDYFVLPRIRNGNMLVMRQPPRSDSKNDESGIFHQGIVPINHFYLAAYFYARDYWSSDAIVHLGTHGSQEYLGGKERGLSIYDQGNLAVWDTPVVYPFIVDDVGEAMQTKRRGRATVIGHMTPPFAAAGLHGDIAVLHELMHQYKSLDQGGVKQKTAKQIVETCLDANICKDIGWEQAQIDADFDGFYEVLHTHMEELATANQPLGLHTFGFVSEQRLMVSTLIQMLGSDFSRLAGEFEHEEYTLTNHKAHKHDDDHSHEHEHDAEHSHNYHSDNSVNKNVEEIKPGDHEKIEEMAGFKTVLNYIVKPVHNHTDVEQPVAFDDLSEELAEAVAKGKKLYTAMTEIRELRSMSDFLSGKYIPVKNGGDPIRHPEAVPTGFNLMGFDPSKVPTKAAYEQGKELVEQMIMSHYNKHGKYPDKMAFSLWSIETMRHYGVLEAQALYAMGVKPIWNQTGRVMGTEVIPYSELKRPRVDVVLSATGLYRDAFPTVMQRLATAVKQVAELKEESNPIWRNSQKVKQDLLEQGVSEEDAEYLSTVRVFSNESGDYGSGTDELAWASDKWETDAVIAENYMNKMGYYFGADRSRWGKKITDKNGKNINLYGKQLSGTDIALFSRSSNVYGMLSSDDPFEYFGSLALAVRNLDGKSPDMMISNLRDANNAKAEDAGLFMSKELRTRSFHPRWIKEMQKEGYSGAVGMSSRMDNFFGWQVVDPNLVRSDQWDEFFDVYVDDKLELELDEWFEQVNPEALARMMQRMLEADRKEYWDASPERLKKLVETYSEFVEKYDLFVDNEKLKEHVTELANGFGLAAPNFNAEAASIAEAMAAPAQQMQNAQQVEGQKLVEQKQNQDTFEDNSVWYSIAGLLFIFFIGFFYEAILGRVRT